MLMLVSSARIRSTAFSPDRSALDDLSDLLGPPELDGAGAPPPSDGLVRSLTSAFESLGAAAFVTDQDGRILEMTRTASTFGDEVGLFSPTPAGARFPPGIWTLLRPADAGTRTETSILLETAERPIHLEASPLSPSKAAPVLVLARHPQVDRPLGQRIAAAFGLTEAETAVALGLCAGASPEEIAAARTVGLGTVRAQIRTLFSKTLTNRQSQLVAVLLAYA